jgi:hypothetical protein
VTTDVASDPASPEADVRDWDTSVVLYRLAKEHVHKADGYARGAGTVVGRQQREVDSCIATLVLVQAALEAWINWTAGRTGVLLTGGLIDLWEQCGLVAEKAGRPPPPPLSDDDRRFLQTLTAWRNYLLHGDDRAHSRLTNFGLRREQLGAPLARETLRKADVLLEYGSSATGGQLLTSEPLWAGFDR